MNFDQYFYNAQKMIGYFQRNKDETGEEWELGLKLANEWLRLIKQEQLNKNDLYNLLYSLSKVDASHETAYEELKILVHQWKNQAHRLD